MYQNFESIYPLTAILSLEIYLTGILAHTNDICTVLFVVGKD